MEPHQYTVKLTYFKPHGKFYLEGEYKTFQHAMYLIWEEVRGLAAAKDLPGINGNDWHILVDVPDHAHNHPHLIPAPSCLIQDGT